MERQYKQKNTIVLSINIPFTTTIVLETTVQHKLNDTLIFRTESIIDRHTKMFINKNAFQ